MRNAVLVLVLAVLAVVIVPVGGRAQEDADTPETFLPVCSRDFEKLAESTAGWFMLHQPYVHANKDGVSNYVVQMIADPILSDDLPRRTVFLIVELGNLKSEKFGDVVYCLSLGRGGVVLEEMGKNPLKKITPASAQKINI